MILLWRCVQVELVSKIAGNVCGRVCYIGRFFVQLVSQQNCETSCTKNVRAQWDELIGSGISALEHSYIKASVFQRGVEGSLIMPQETIHMLRDSRCSSPGKTKLGSYLINV